MVGLVIAIVFLIAIVIFISCVKIVPQAHA